MARFNLHVLENALRFYLIKLIKLVAPWGGSLFTDLKNDLSLKDSCKNISFITLPLPPRYRFKAIVTREDTIVLITKHKLL